MRPPRPRALLLSLVLFPLAAAAQIKTDLGASATAGAGASAAAGAVSLNAAAVPAPALNAALSPSILSAGPALNLAPAARPGAVGLPASALTPAPALAAPAAAADGAGKFQAPKAAAEAAASQAPPGGPPSAAAAAAPPGSPPVPFVAALNKLGVPEELTSRLLAFLQERHPGNQDLIYHGQSHSFEVANYTARIVENADLPAERKILLILSASLHDVDPERAPETPARVSATLEHLDADPQARALLADFGGRYGFTADQVKALIMATDFSVVPDEMKAKQAAFAAAARAAFPGDDFGLEWGRRLAFVDQASTYLGDQEQARKRVEGLAHEIRFQLAALGKNGGPTDAQILSGTARFLAVLRRSPEFALLPPDLRANFDGVENYFEKRQTTEAWEAAAAPVPARAPPDVAAAKAYIRGIAAGIALNEAQTDALLRDFFEDNGIKPGSPRAEAVRGELLPSKVAAENRSVETLAPALKAHRGSLLKLAAERRTTPAAIEAVLRRRGALDALSGLGEAAFLRQAEFALDRDELESAVERYPDTVQGRFMRGAAADMAARSGKSVEEVARDGIFAYVDFNGPSVRKASTGRDPDVRAVQMVFYITRQDGRWRIGGYRQNRVTGRKDAELIKALKTWLVAGGVPARDLE